jgi:hypothetical protein
MNDLKLALYQSQKNPDVSPVAVFTAAAPWKAAFTRRTVSQILKVSGAACLLTLGIMPCRSFGTERSATIQWNDDHQSFKFVVTGEVHFTDDDTDIKSISRDGSLIIERKTQDGRHHFEAHASENGGIERVYSIDGKTQPWVPAGRKWLAAQQLPDLIRETAIDAPERVARIRRIQGEAGVLDYISLTHSDGAKRAYFEEFFAGEPSSLEATRRAIHQIANEIHSDGDKAALLKVLASRYIGADDLRAPFFAAERTIHSAGDRRSLLNSVLKENDPNRATLQCIIESASTISSDGDKADVLIKTIGFSTHDGVLQSACLDSANTLHSDGDHQSVLAALLQDGIASDEVFCRAFASAARISSDGDKANFLSAAANKAPVDQSVFDSFLGATRTIRSDGDKARVLMAWLKRADQPEGAFSRIRTFSEAEIHSEGDQRKIEKLVEQRRKGLKDSDS